MNWTIIICFVIYFYLYSYFINDVWEMTAPTATSLTTLVRPFILGVFTTLSFSLESSLHYSNYLSVLSTKNTVSPIKIGEATTFHHLLQTFVLTPTFGRDQLWSNFASGRNLTKTSWKEYGADHTDTIAWGWALDQVIDNTKHRTGVDLPLHLYFRLKSKDLIMIMPEDEDVSGNELYSDHDNVEEVEVAGNEEDSSDSDLFSEEDKV